MNNNSNLSFNVISDSYNNSITITIPKQTVNKLFQEALKAQRKNADTYGFCKGEVPLCYIEQNYKLNILDHLKEFLFNHCVHRSLYLGLIKEKIALIGDPQLKSIKIDSDQDAEFHFNITKAQNIENKWKSLYFKHPDRKNYKDLDRQVESFLDDETKNLQEYKNSNKSEISPRDWVCFEMFIVDQDKKELICKYKNTLWIKISPELVDKDLHEIFIGKKIGDLFYSNHPFFQNYISGKLNLNYVFGIFIKDFLPNDYFSIEDFKHHFQLKSTKDIHKKLIQVFSHRNDLSQRRETIEAALKALLKYHFFNIPKDTLEKQRQWVLDQVHDNPDYLVYKAQSDFKEKIKKLAEKQLKETIIVDLIAYQEDIKVNHKDIIAYLNLLKRSRAKEFLYFRPPSSKLDTLESPIPEELITLQCLREKTLNYIIKKLAR